jgi:predicted DsbA family dithiol-disulfide isomerase
LIAFTAGFCTSPATVCVDGHFEEFWKMNKNELHFLNNLFCPWCFIYYHPLPQILIKRLVQAQLINMAIEEKMQWVKEWQYQIVSFIFNTQSKYMKISR